MFFLARVVLTIPNPTIMCNNCKSFAIAYQVRFLPSKISDYFGKSNTSEENEKC